MASAGLEAVPAVDAFWLHAETPDNLMVINGVLALDGRLEMADLRATVEGGLLGFDRFRRPVVHEGGRAYWGPPADFDPAAHFFETELEAGAGEPELQRLVSELVSAPLDPARPLWCVYLVHGHPKGSVVVARVHHCIADGIALVYVLLSLARSGDGVDRPPAERPSAWARVRGAIGQTKELVHHGWRFMEHLNPQEILRQGHDITAAATKLTTLSSQDHPVFKGRLGTKKQVAWSDPMPLARIKAMGKRLEAKINDVLLAMAAGALRRYLADRGTPVDGEVLRATVPVNLRPLSQAHRLGNRFGLVFLHLPIHLADARARLEAVKAEMSEIKGGAEAVMAFGLLRAIGAGPEALEAQAVDLFSRKTSMVLTNVPGPRERLEFAGRPLRRVMFWVPQTGSVSMGLSIISYVEDVMVGIQADAGLVPDPGEIARAMQVELEHMFEVFEG